jgi:hypothetical protein
MNRKEIIIFLGLIILTLPFGWVTGEWASLFLSYISIGIIIFSRDMTRDFNLYSFAILAILARHFASLINFYYVLLIGADMDAVGFHLNASTMAGSIQPAWFGEFGSVEASTKIYCEFLAFFYRIFGDSKLLGQTLSIIAFSFSFLFLIKITNKLRLTRYSVGLGILYGLLPSAIIFTSITLREAYQMLFFLMNIHFAICLRKKATLPTLIMLIIGAAGLAALHNGLQVYSIFLVCLSLFWGLGFSFTNWKMKKTVTKLVGILLIVGIVSAWITYASDVGGASKALMSGEGGDYAGNYRDRTSTDRSTYGGKLDTSSLLAFIPSAALVSAFYMFAPFPWQISSAADVYGAFEGYLRLILIYYGFKTWYRSRGERRSQWGYLWICYFSLEFLWAMGTSNWGTAIRHHLIAYGVLVILGGPGFIRSLTKPISRIGRRFGKPGAAPRFSGRQVRPIGLLPNRSHSSRGNL